MTIDKNSLNPTADDSIPPISDLVMDETEQAATDSVFTGEEIQVAGLGGIINAGRKALTGGKKAIDDAPVSEKVVDSPLPETTEEALDAAAPDKPKAVFNEKQLPETPGRLEAQSQQKAEALLTSDLQDYDEFRDKGHLPNFDVMQTEDDVKAAIGLLAEKTKTAINAERREVIPDVELKKLAYDLDLEEDVVRQVMSRDQGETLMPEQIIAARQMLHTSAEEMVKLAKLVNDPATNSVENKLKFRRQMAFHREYTSKFMGARAEAGRALRAYGVPLGSSDDQAAMMDSMLAGLSGNTADMAKKLSVLDNPAAVQKMLKRGFSEKFSAVAEEVFINSILSGLKTQMVNIGGNGLIQGMDLVERSVAAGFGRVLSNEERITLGEVRAQAYATGAAFFDAMKMAGKAFRTGESSDMVDKLETHEKAISSEFLEVSGVAGRMVDFVGTTIRFPTERGLTTMDEFFKEMGRRGDLGRQGYREAMDAFHAGEISKEEIPQFVSRFVDSPPEEALTTANAAALYKTFQTELGEKGRSIQNVKQKARPLPLYAVAPFIKTPVNILKMAFAERSPLGVFSAKIRKDIKEGGAARDLALARMSMGTATIGGMWMLLDNGLMTGSGPSSPESKKANRAAGIPPYSFKDPTTGKWHSYARSEPLSYILGSTADAYEMIKWSDSADELTDADTAAQELMMLTMAAIAENTVNKTFMQGLSDFSNAMNEPKRYMGRYLEGLAMAHIPFSGTRRDISKIQDPYLKEAWTLADKIRATSGIPGWSEGVPNRLNMFGEPILHMRSDAMGVFSLFPEQKQTTDPVKLENARFSKTLRKNPITEPSKSIVGSNREAAGIKLDSRQYSRLKELSRAELRLEIDGRKRTFMETMFHTIHQSAYIKASDYKRFSVLQGLQSRYDRAAAEALLREDIDLSERVKERDRIVKQRRFQ